MSYISPDSYSRFRRKGYTEHVVNPPKKSTWRRDGLTNHDRHTLHQAQREMARKQAKEAAEAKK